MRATGLATVRRALPLLEVDWRRVALAVALGALTLGSAVGLAAASAWLIARASQMPHVLQLSMVVVAVRALGISRAVFRYLERLSSHEVALRGVVALRSAVYARLAAGRAQAVVGLRRGDVLARVGADVDAVGDVVVRGIIPAAVAGVVSLGSVVLVGWFSPAAAGALAVALLVAGVAGPLLAARSAAAAEVGAVRARADVAAASMTILDGATELRVGGRMPAAVEALRRAEADVTARLDAAARPAAWAQAVGTLAMGASVLAVLLLCIPATVAGELPPVHLAVAVLTPLAAFEGTAALPGAAVQVVRSGAAAARVLALLDAAAEPPTPTPSSPTPAPLPAPRPARTRVAHENGGPGTRSRGEPAFSASWERGAGGAQGAGGAAGAQRAGGAVVARGLVCGWPGRPPAVAGLDLRLEPGRAVVLLGPSGVGKTSVLLTLAGLLAPLGGVVEVAGRDSRELSREELAATVAFTAEDAHVFDTTLLENLRVARGDVTPEEAREALARAGLGDLLARLPEGLDTTVGGGATTLSGGERRRLLLARALLHPAPIMLLDEPGEHLDPATADALVRDVLAVGRDRGVLVVTHRPVGLEEADEVVVLGHEGDRDLHPAHVVSRGRHTGDMSTSSAPRRS